MGLQNIRGDHDIWRKPHLVGNVDQYNFRTVPTIKERVLWSRCHAIAIEAVASVEIRKA